MWDSLFVNVAVIALTLVVWQTIAESADLSAPRSRALVLGTLLGLAGCLSIATAQEILPGIRIDLRIATVAGAAFFGGPLAAALAGGLTGGLRILYGGEGVLAGLVAIALAVLIGLALRRRQAGRAPGNADIALLALGAATAYGFAYLFVPWHALPAVFAATFVPMFTLNLLTTFCFAILLAHETRRQDLIRQDMIYRQMVEVLPDPLMAKDAAGRVIAANSAAAALYGAARASDLLGRTNRDLLPLEQAGRAAREEREVLRSGEMLSVECPVAWGGRTDRWMSMRKVALFDPVGRPFGTVLHARDVTEHHRLLDMKSQFVSLVSHELRTPLTSVRGALGLLGTTLPSATPKAARRLLDIAQRNGERLVRLINDILDVEKIENGNLTFHLAPHAVAPLVRSMLPDFERYMPDQRVTLRLEDRAPGAVAEVDAGRFEQVLSNLVSNAIKFSAPGGTVTIGLGREGTDLVLTVRDEGRGIPEVFRTRVFERFEQSDASDTRTEGGTGLGLHIAEVLVERMGGRIGYHSREGEGTTFFVRLPARWPAPLAATPSAGPPAGPVAARRLLRVGDDDTLGSALAELLSGEVEVDHVAGLGAARAALGARRYDLLVIDDELTDGSGLSLLDGRADPPPCIVLAAHEARAAPHAAILHRFARARVEAREVAHAIRAALGHRDAA